MKEKTEPEPPKLKYYCEVCQEYFTRPGHKKGEAYREVTHCGKPAFYRGTA